MNEQGRQHSGKYWQVLEHSERQRTGDTATVGHRLAVVRSITRDVRQHLLQRRRALCAIHIRHQIIGVGNELRSGALLR